MTHNCRDCFYCEPLHTENGEVAFQCLADNDHGRRQGWPHENTDCPDFIMPKDVDGQSARGFFKGLRSRVVEHQECWPYEDAPEECRSLRTPARPVDWIVCKLSREADQYARKTSAWHQNAKDPIDCRSLDEVSRYDLREYPLRSNSTDIVYIGPPP